MAQLNPEEVAEVGKWLFRRFVKENSIPDDQRRYADITNFLQWMGNTTLSRYDVAAETRCSMEAVEFIMDLPHSPTGPNQLIAMWPYLTLSHRTMKTPLRSMQILMVLTWDDGVTVPLSVFAHKDTTDGELNDAAVSHLIMTRTQILSDKIVEKSLDDMHDENEGNQTRDAYRTIQLIVECLQTASKDITEEEISRINLLLNFMASMFPETIPEALMQRLRANTGPDGTARDNEVPSTLEELSGEGGWDDPG